MVELDAGDPVWNDEMRALKIAGAAIAAVIVVIALLLVIGIPSSFLTSQIQDRVERETGYKLTINGGAKVGLWPSLNVTLNDITLQNPKERDNDNRITASSIQADMTLASVWAGKPAITELVVVRPVVNVPLQRERLRETAAPAKPATASANAVSIEHISVTGGTKVRHESCASTATRFLRRWHRRRMLVGQRLSTVTYANRSDGRTGDRPMRHRICNVGYHD